MCWEFKNPIAEAAHSLRQSIDERKKRKGELSLRESQVEDINKELEEFYGQQQEAAKDAFWTSCGKMSQAVIFFLILQTFNICFFGAIYSVIENTAESRACYNDQRKTLNYMFETFTDPATHASFQNGMAVMPDSHYPDDSYDWTLLQTHIEGLHDFDTKIPMTYNQVLKLVHEVQSGGNLYFDADTKLQLGRDQCSKNWEYKGALFFMAQASTAVGYGGGAPTTLIGMVIFTILCVPHVMFGVFFLSALGNVFKLILDEIHLKVDKACCCGLHVKIMLIAGLFFLLPAGIYTAVKDQDDPWGYWQALYFQMVSTTTLGFGEFVGDYEKKKLDSEINLHIANILLLYFGMSIFLGYLDDIFAVAELMEAQAFGSCLLKKCHPGEKDKAEDLKKQEKALKKRLNDTIGLRMSMLEIPPASEDDDQEGNNGAFDDVETVQSVGEVSVGDVIVGDV